MRPHLFAVCAEPFRLFDCIVERENTVLARRIGTGWKNLVMLAVGCVLLYLAIKKEYEPLLLLPIAFGMILTNLPGAGLFHTEMWNDEFLNPDSPYYHSYRHVMAEGGLLDVLYIGVKAGIYPCLIFLGVGAMSISPPHSSTNSERQFK